MKKEDLPSILIMQKQTVNPFDPPILAKALARRYHQSSVFIRVLRKASDPTRRIEMSNLIKYRGHFPNDDSPGVTRQWLVIGAANFGGPQSRLSCFLIGRGQAATEGGPDGKPVPTSKSNFLQTPFR